MRTIFHSLAWKEWHEHKWKLASIVAIVWGIAALPFLELDRGTLIGFHVALIMGVVPLAVFIGLGAAASERSRGTLRFLQALPVPMWHVALHKVAFGLITILVPALLAVTLVVVWLECLDLRGIEYGAANDFAGTGRNGHIPFVLTSYWPVNTALMLTLVATSFFLWTIAAGVNRKDEVSAGAVALTIIFGWCVPLTLAWNLMTERWGPFPGWENLPTKWLAIIGLATAPGGLATVADATGRETWFIAVAFCVAAITHLALGAWYVHRFGRISNLEVRSPKAAAINAARLDWLGPPRLTPFTAIVWKQFRESGPLVLVGVAIVAATVALLFVGADRNFNPRLGELYSGVAASMGFAMAMIVGIGAFRYDVGPALNTFWRSRPINPDLWFWTKFLSGLGILLAAIYGPIFLIALAGDESGLANASSPEALVIVSMHLAVFAAAIAMTVLVRTAVYAAILSVAVVYLGVFAVAVLLGIGRLMRGEEWPAGIGELFDMTESQAAAGLLFSFFVSTVLAWLAVRNDWGQKSRS